MPSRSAGFTLLEVLVAFVIAAISIGVVMRVFSGGLNNLRVADEYSRAVFLAQSKLAAVGVETPLQPGEEAGEFGRQFQWRVAVSPYETERVAKPASPNLYEVRVDVSWREGREARRIELVTLRVGA